MPKSAIRYGRPKCKRSEKRKRNRRGKHKKNLKQGGTKNNKKIQACVQADRSEFNRHVTNLIVTEYTTQHGRVPEGTLNQKKEMIEWKFDQMDTNR